MIDGGNDPDLQQPAVHKESEMKPKASEIKSVNDLIWFAYQQAGKRINVPKAIVRKLNDGLSVGDDSPLLSPEDLARVLALDPFLAVPPRVLAFAATAKPPVGVRRQLEQVMQAVLCGHVLFSSGVVEDAMRTRPDDPTAVLDDLRDRVRRITPDELCVESKALTGSMRAKLMVNAVTSVVLLLALRDEWGVDEVVDSLHRHVWRDYAEVTDRLSGIGAVADAREFLPLAYVARIFDYRSRDASRQANDAKRDAETAQVRASTAEVVLSERDQQIASLSEEITTLHAELESLQRRVQDEEANRRHDKSHHLDEFERLRTRTMRLLGSQVALLSDGLSALRNGDPQVTDEFIDRIISSLNEELAHLRGTRAES